MGEMGKVYRGEISPDAIRPPPTRMEQPNPLQQQKQPTPPLQQQQQQSQMTQQSTNGFYQRENDIRTSYQPVEVAQPPSVVQPIQQKPPPPQSQPKKNVDCYPPIGPLGLADQTSQPPSIKQQDSFNNEQNYRAAQTNRFRSQSPAGQGWYNSGNQSNQFSNQQTHFYPSPPSPTNRGGPQQNGGPPPPMRENHSYKNGDSLVWNQGPASKPQQIPPSGPPPPTRKAFDRSMSEPGWNNVRRESYSPSINSNEQSSWNTQARQQDNYYQPVYDLPEPWIKAEKHFDHLIEHGFVPASDMKSARKLS